MSSAVDNIIFSSQPKGARKPLWTVIIPTYNCASYLKETLQSVLLQDPGEEKMEIIVVDDFSTKDDPEEVVRMYGKERVGFYRQKENVGKVRNYETGIKASKGSLIHILHGDDKIEEGFYDKFEEYFNIFSDVGAIYSQANYINEKGQKIGRTGEIIPVVGIIPDFVEEIAMSQKIQPPSIVIKKRVYEEIGAYDARLNFFEDWEMYTRLANKYKVAFTPEILASYRVHTDSSSQKSIKNGERIKVQKKAIRIMNSYLDDELIKRIKRKRNIKQAYYLVQFIPKVLKNKDLKTYFILLFFIFSFSIHPSTLYKTVRFSFIRDRKSKV